MISNFYCFAFLDNRLTYKVGAPIPITGVQFGMRVEFGYDCLIPADFNNDVSSGYIFNSSNNNNVNNDNDNDNGNDNVNDNNTTTTTNNNNVHKVRLRLKRTFYTAKKF